MDRCNLYPCASLALMTFKNYKFWNFPDCPVVETLCFQCRGFSSIPGWVTKIPHAMGGSQNKNSCHLPSSSENLRAFL